MVPFLGFNPAEITLARPLQGGSQAQPKPSSVKAPVVEAECEENPAPEMRQEDQSAGNRYQKQTWQKAHAAQCQIPEAL